MTQKPILWNVIIKEDYAPRSQSQQEGKNLTDWLQVLNYFLS